MPDDTRTSTNPDIEFLRAEIAPVVSATDAAKLLGITPKTLYNRANLGLPPRCMRAGRRIRYTREALIEYLTAAAKAERTA